MVAWNIQFCFMVLPCTFLILGLVWYVQFLWNRRNLYIYSWNVPGPFAFPLVGAAYVFRGGPHDILNTLLKLQKKFPGLCKVWLGPQPIYIVGEPEHIRMILTHPKCMEKNFMYKSLSSVIGTGLLTAPLAKWKKHRKMFNPSFNQNILNSYVEAFSEKSNILNKELLKDIGKKNVDVYMLLYKCTLDMICETTFGVKLEMQTADNVVATSFNRMIEIMFIRAFRIWYYLEFIWKLSPISRELDKHVNIFRSVEMPILRREIKKLKLRREMASTQPAEVDEADKRRLMTFYMVLCNSDLTKEEVRQEIEIFASAGSDTTAAAMIFLFEMLGMFQDVQQKVYKEVIEIVGEDRDVAASDLPNLKYTDRVIKESLRLFPPAPIFLRAIGEDIDLGTTILPAGSSALFCPLYVHRNPIYWPDPLRFDPDRFLPEEVAKRQPYTYFPFSLGSRNCIGGQYAVMSMKTIVATVIRKYKIFSDYKTVEEINLSNHVILKMTDGTKISLELR